MKRLFGLILVGLLLAGCKTDAPVCDPFYGRTTIPPPATGSVTGQPANPCYQPPPLTPPQMSSGNCPPVVQIPTQPMAPASSSTAPALNNPALPPAATTPPVLSQPGAAPNYSAPRPPSTGTSSAPAARAAPLAPSSPATSPSTSPGLNPYLPPASGDYRGSSTRGSTPLIPTQPQVRTAAPSYTNVAATRSSTAADDRMPRPVDDTLAAGSIGGRQPGPDSFQPRGSGDALGRPVDIMDLPKSP